MGVLSICFQSNSKPDGGSTKPTPQICPAAIRLSTPIESPSIPNPESPFAQQYPLAHGPSQTTKYIHEGLFCHLDWIRKHLGDSTALAVAESVFLEMTGKALGEQMDTPLINPNIMALLVDGQRLHVGPVRTDEVIGSMFTGALFCPDLFLYTYFPCSLSS